MGQAFRFILTDGEYHDVTQAQALIHGIYPEAVLADKTYDADGLIFNIADRNAKVVIPSKANRHVHREFDKSPHRNVIKRFFARIKQFRRIATRYDKLASRSKSFFTLVASIEWLK